MKNKNIYELSIRKAGHPLYVVTVAAVNPSVAKWIACSQENIKENQIVEVN